jgi:hypothetical protein
MSNQIFIITGASGTGKTSLLPFLKKSLGNDFRVYDFDTILRPYDFTEQWETDVIKKCLEVIQKESEQNVVILGLIRPWKFLKYAEKVSFSKKIKFLLLDITEDVREKRLRGRVVKNSLILDTEELLSFRKWFDNNNLSILDTSKLSLLEVSDEIVQWIEKGFLDPKY